MKSLGTFNVITQQNDVCVRVSLWEVGRDRKPEAGWERADGRKEDSKKNDLRAHKTFRQPKEINSLGT